MNDTEQLAAVNRFLAEPRNAIVCGVRPDGRPHMTPNWFLWTGERFLISTTRDRAKYRVFSNDPRVQLMIDDATGFRYVRVDGTVEISEDIESGLERFRALRNKHGRAEQSDEELRAEMVRDHRVLLIVTPDRAQADWHCRGF